MRDDDPFQGMGFGTVADDDFNPNAQLAQSIRRCLWATKTTYAQAIGQQLCYVDTPPWMARNWTVHLLAMRYQTGNVSAGGFTPDQQASVLCQVSMNFGAMGASENVVIDYPWTGCSFEVSAASLDVTFLGGAAVNVLPTVGAFLVPAGRGGGGAGLKCPPTHTETFQVGGGPGAFFDVPVPPRARCYSMALGAGISLPAQIVGVQQMNNQNGFSNPVKTDNVATDTPFSVDYEFYTGSLIANQTLYPSTTSIRITNNSVPALPLVVRFELDLG